MDGLHRQLRSVTLLALLAGAPLAACRPADAGSAARPGVVVDSAVPREAALARFRAELPEPAALSGGAASREALVRRFVRALEQRDTVALRDLVLSIAEFAYLYYPTAREALPPYELGPELMWFRQSGESEQGARRALDEFGGRKLGYAGHICGYPRHEGRNTLWGSCRVRLGDGEQVLFGLIVEREGRFKFVTYANKL